MCVCVHVSCRVIKIMDCTFVVSSLYTAEENSESNFD